MSTISAVLQFGGSVKATGSSGRKIQDMGLVPQIEGPAMFRALRMSERRFVKAFVNCHPKTVAAESMQFYINAKGVKRLAESSKKNVHRAFHY